MSSSDLATRIADQQARIGVIGLGYVGLPVACTIAKIGFEVTGIDLKAERIAQINAGINPIEGHEPGLSELLADVIALRRLHASTDYQALADADVVLINVETPVDDQHQPRYVALKAACASLGQVLQPGALVIIESTVAPGTLDKVVLPILQETSGRKVNQGFFLATCPERVMPGKLLHNLAHVSRVIGGSSPQAAELALGLYRQIVHAELDTTDCITAELVKTAENAYRDVQIAFANEVALICEVAGSDVWRVRELVNKSPYRQMHFPGAGVGGHCIPKDPWLLAYGAGGQAPLRLIPSARAVNDGMPAHVADLVISALQEAGLPPASARVVILGYAYLEDSDDARNTPTQPLVDRLRSLGVAPMIHDPYVKDYAAPLAEVIQGADCLVLMVKHSAYLALDLLGLKPLMRTAILVDGRNLWPQPEGFIYRCIGRAMSSRS